MNKVKIFFIIAAGIVVVLFLMNTKGKLAEQSCLMAGGQWSATDKSCDR